MSKDPLPPLQAQFEAKMLKVVYLHVALLIMALTLICATPFYEYGIILAASVFVAVLLQITLTWATRYLSLRVTAASSIIVGQAVSEIKASLPSPNPSTLTTPLTEGITRLNNATDLILQVLPKNEKGELVPLQESFMASIRGMKGQEVKNLRNAAKTLAEGFEEMAQDEFVQDLAEGVPEAINLAQASGLLQEMLPSIVEKSPDGIIGTYGPVLANNAGKLYSLAKARRGGNGKMFMSKPHNKSEWGLQDR